jgi:hypothetical protein
MALTNDTYLNLKDLTFALIGREYAEGTASLNRLKSLWNYAAKKAYNQTNYWERFLVFGEARLIANGNQVPQSEVNKDDIGTYLRIYKDDPDVSRGTEYDFMVNSNGAVITGAGGIPQSGLYLDPLDNGLYLQPNNSEDPVEVFVSYKKAYNPNYGFSGQDEEVPAELLPYMAHLAAYTWQRSVDQNSDEANFSLSLALVNSILEDELAKISDQNIANSYLVKKIRTNYNQLII